MKETLSGIRTEGLSQDMPSGVIEYAEKWVQSAPIHFRRLGGAVYVKGRFDTLIHLNDGSFALVDFKTADQKMEHIPLYSRQLHAYALALKHPANGCFSVSPITRLGLLVFEPEHFFHLNEGVASLVGSLKWKEIEKDNESFLEFLAEVLRVLMADNPPPRSPLCSYCEYRDVSRRTQL